MFLHLAEGLVLAVFVGLFTNVDSKPFWLFFGGVAALFPDIDFLIFLYFKNWKIDRYSHEHRDILHRPWKLALGGAILFYCLFEFPYSLLWFLAIIVHCLHDTFDGWGIRWIPFGRKYFTLAPYSPKTVIDDKSEQREIVSENGDDDWFKKESGINKDTIREFLIFLASLGTAVLWIFV